MCRYHTGENKNTHNPVSLNTGFYTGFYLSIVGNQGADE